MPRFLIPAGLVLAGIALIAGLMAIAPRTPSTAPVAVALHEGFGKLPTLSANEVAIPLSGSGAPQTADAKTSATAPAVGVSTRTSAGETFVGSPTAANGAEPMLLAPDIGVSSSAAGSAPSTGSGQAGVTAPGKPSIVRPMPPPEQYLPPRVIYTWEGKNLPQIPAELAVFRNAPTPLAAQIDTLGSAVGLTLPGGRITSFSYRSDDGLTFSFDAGSGMLSWYREQSWPADTQPQREATISDADAIAAANAFLEKLGVHRAAYGEPQVVQFENPCGNGRACIMEGNPGGGGTATPMTATKGDVAVSQNGMIAPSIWPGPWWQPSVTVRYAAKLDGLPTLEWDGSDSGAITVQVSTLTRDVESGSVLLLTNLQRSLYGTQTVEKILDEALHGGSNPWGGYENGVFTPAEEAKRPVVRIRLTEARLGYLQKWSDLGDGPTSYFLPVVAFRGTVTDQYRNSSPYAAIVSALDPSVFASEEPTPVPIPYGKPMPLPEPFILGAPQAAERE